MAENKAEGTTTLATKVADKADKIKWFVIVLLLVVVAAMVIFSLVRRQAAEREAAAESRLYQAEIDMLTQPEQDGVAIFGDLAKEYAGLPAGARALIFQFSQAFNTRQYDKAEAAIRELLAKYPKHEFIDRARLALGQALVMQDKTGEAAALFRELTSVSGSPVYPEAKLALAQTLERQAEEAKDDPEEYRRRLEAAREEYNDMVGQARSPLQRSFWPQSIVLPADFALTLLNDKLAGHEHKNPVAAPRSAASALPATIDMTQFAPPSAEEIATDGEVGGEAVEVEEENETAAPSEAEAAE